MDEIDRVFTKYPFFGSRQIAAYLPRNGFHAGRHRVRRLMGLMGLQAIYKGPNTSKKHQQHHIYPYLLRKLPMTRPNHVRCSDILTSQCAVAFSIWSRSWIGQRVKC